MEYFAPLPIYYQMDYDLYDQRHKMGICLSYTETPTYVPLHIVVRGRATPLYMLVFAPPVGVDLPDSQCCSRDASSLQNHTQSSTIRTVR